MIRPGSVFDRHEAGMLIWRERRLLAAALASAVMGPVAAMALPFGAKLVIDDVIGGGQTDLLPLIALGAGLGVLFQAVTAYGLTQSGSAAGQRAVARIRRRLHRHILELPVGYFDSHPTGTLVSRCMADADQVRTLFGPALFQLVSGGLTAVLAFAVLAWIDWRLTALVAAGLALVTLGLTRGFGRLSPGFRSVSELQAGLASRITELFGGIRIVKAAAAERREAFALARESHRLTRASLAAHRQVAVLAAGMALASGGVSLGLLVLGGLAVTRGAMTLGDLAMFVFLVGLLGTPLVQVAAFGGELGRAFAALARIREVLAMPTERIADQGRIPVRGVIGTVVFDRVSYRYGSGPLVLRDVSLVAPVGSTTALVGPNGAGKSTMVNLLLGFDHPCAGHVLVDGRSLAASRVADYRRHVAVVLQRDQIVDGTIADNIRYGRPAATTTEFRWATRLAHCDELVARLPHGYDTRVGERGVRLSGGERQRIAIARAFLADPRILLLDEATAHLDAESERLLQDALAVLCRGRTTFVIAHRLSTIQRADQILVLRGGAVVERGTHEELLASRGQYWQTSGADPDAWQKSGIEAGTHVN